MLLALAIAAAFFFVAYRRRDVGLALFCFLLPTYLLRFSIPLVVTSVPSTVLEALFIALLAAWLATDAKRPDAWRALENWALPLTLFVLGGTLGVLVSADTRGALGLWRAYFIEPVLFFALATDIISRTKRGTRVLAALGAAVALLGVIAIAQKLTGWGIENPAWRDAATRRITGVYGFPNAVALFAAPAVTLLSAWTVALWRGNAPRAKLLSACAATAAALGTLATVLAVSKGGMIGIAVGLLFIALADRKLRPLALVAVIAGCAALFVVPGAMDYAVYVGSGASPSSSVRAIIWNDTAQMFRDRPVFGAGLSGYPTGIAPYHVAHWIEIFQYPHNIVLNFWSETGLIGLAGFLWIIARFFRMAWRERKRGGWAVTAACAAMLATLVHGTVDVPYFKNDLAFLFWFVVAMVESARVAARQPIAEKNADARKFAPRSDERSG